MKSLSVVRSYNSENDDSDDQSDELPFTPTTDTLRDVLRRKYIRPVTQWLLGTDPNSVLAQEGNSAWESALTLLFLAEASDIFEEKGEEEDMRRVIPHKCHVVARWLLHSKVSEGPYVYWEKVTWDTSVVIRGLLLVLKKYGKSFSEEDRTAILDSAVRGTRWLYHRFSQWDTQVKYPFGPADVAQIVITILYLAQEYPDVYDRICREYYSEGSEVDLAAEVVKYLLHNKTEKTIAVKIMEGSEAEALVYWWDDYFSTAEVIDALALFYKHCQVGSRGDRYGDILSQIKETLIRACAYLEHGQLDGMWGTHVDTLKVIYSYVTIRNLIPQREAAASDPLIVPEIHTIFKSIRWMCDEKQIFRDGSFLHTMFLTIFYAHALLAVYRFWLPAGDTIEKLYDDVVWASPVRTTPERSKRLNAELQNSRLRDELEQARETTRQYQEMLRSARRTRSKIIVTVMLILISVPLFMLVGNLLGLTTTDFIRVERVGDFFQYAAVALTIFAALLGLIWKHESLFVW